MAIAVASGEERLLFLGDIIYDLDLSTDESENGKEIGNPAWPHAAVDVNPAQALLTRDRLFAQTASERMLLMAYHIDFPGLGYIVRDGAVWRWQAFGNTN